MLLLRINGQQVRFRVDHYTLLLHQWWRRWCCRRWRRTRHLSNLTDWQPCRAHNAANWVDCILEYVAMQIGIDIAQIAPPENWLFWAADDGTIALQNVKHLLLDGAIFGENSNVPGAVVRAAVLFVKADAGANDGNGDKDTG